MSEGHRAHNFLPMFWRAYRVRTGTAIESPPLAWWRSSIVGYLLSPVSVGLMTLARLFVDEPLIVWTPFCLVVILEAVLWGIGPALLTMTLAIIAISYLVIPNFELLTLDVWNDLRLLGPFVLVQTVITWLAAQHAVQYRRLRAYAAALQAVVLELARANRQLEQTKRRESLFFTRAAHELRTPLTTILGEAQLALRRLRKTRVTGEVVVWRAHFEHIEARAHGLQALVEDLIELYHLRTEETPLRWGHCNLNVLCTELVEQQRNLTDRQIELALPIEPIILHADCERLRTALMNIVDNAATYAPPSTPIQIHVQTTTRSVSIHIHNEDTELTAEQQEQLFEPFYRTPAAEARYREGHGLGLTISQACIERHGGHITIESLAGTGVTVIVNLPAQLLEPPSARDA